MSPGIRIRICPVGSGACCRTQALHTRRAGTRGRQPQGAGGCQKRVCGDRSRDPHCVCRAPNTPGSVLQVVVRRLTSCLAALVTGAGLAVSFMSSSLAQVACRQCVRAMPLYSVILDELHERLRDRKTAYTRRHVTQVDSSGAGSSLRTFELWSPVELSMHRAQQDAAWLATAIHCSAV